MLFAGQVFRDDRRLGDGAPARDHRASADAQWARLGRPRAVPIDVEVPAPPRPLAYLWEWFWEASLGMERSGMTFPTLSWQSLEVWAVDFKRVRLAYWEAVTLLRLSHLRASIESEKPTRTQGKT